MSITYDLSDLLSNMIELEITGAAFYGEQARRSGNPLLATLFGQLAEQEQKHRAVYEHWRAQLADEPPVDPEYRDYLREIISGKFHLDAAAAARCIRPVEVIDFGLGLENDSIRFIDAYGKITGSRHQEMVEKIRQQEQQHVLSLTKMKAALLEGRP